MSRHIPPSTLAFGHRLKELLPFVLLTLVVSLLVFLPLRGESAITWRGDFETGNLSQWAALQAKDPSRVTIQSDVVRQGRYAARFEVRPGDNNVAGSGSGERAHLYIGNSTTGGVDGQEQYWAWSTYFPSDFDAPMGGWNSFVSFHHTGSTGQVNIQFAVWDMATIGLRVLGGSSESPIRKDLALAPLEKGRWYDFVFHVKWSADGSVGFVEVWVNGTRVVPKTMTPTLYSGQGVYLKMGYYRAAYSGTTVVYHDGMRRGSTYDEVAAEFPSGSISTYGVSSSIGEGATLAGTTLWSAEPTRSTSAVAFSVDGTTVSTDSAAPYEFSLDTTAYANGSHTFRVDATASDGSKASTSAVATVSNVLPESVEVTQNLVEGQTVEGVLSWTASTFESEASKVEFSVNGAVVGSDGAAPYTLSYDTTKIANGTNSFGVKAFGTNGSSATAAANVNVANSTDQPASSFSIGQNVSDGQQLSGTHSWSVWSTGKAVSRATFWIDGKRVVGLKDAPYETAVDTREYADGTRQFRVVVQAADGSTLTATANAVVANSASTPPPASALTVSQSVSSGQTLSGVVSWTASPAGQTVSKVEFWIDGSVRWVENLLPYVYGGDGKSLDTFTMSNGSHTLEVRAFGSDGSTAKASALVSVSNTTPALVSSILDGATISGNVSWTIEPNGFKASRMEFFIDGKLMWTERYEPWVYGGDGRYLDTGTLSKGAHELEIRATGTDGAVRELTLRVTVA